MSDTPIPLSCKDVGKPGDDRWGNVTPLCIEERKRHYTSLQGATAEVLHTLRHFAQICGNNADTLCRRPNPFIHSRQIPKGICGHPSGYG